VKRSFKNINIPYHYYDKVKLRSGYIYNNKEYFDLNLLFNDYVGSYLTYHFEINNELKEVHNLSDIANYMLENYETFEIPDKYKDEYSQDEYKYFNSLKRDLLNDKLEKSPFMYRPMKFKDIFKYPIDYLVFLELKKYKDVSMPKKIYSKILKRDVYVLYGEFYENAMYALTSIFYGSFYYQFSGDGVENSCEHSHQHDFEAVIDDIFSNFDNFIIYDFQKQFYSKQELDFIDKLVNKLKEDNYTSIFYKKSNDDFDKTYEEYKNFKDNKKHFKLFILNIKDYFKSKKFKKDVINSHKTK